ncbi:mitoferrin-2 isoform X2 [Calonectris borealis]|uniref:mitoferrin-2 isoform X2 n=1 Tax=Calonectris borealis TaxID=1323832 RepID=UPI003F4B70A2
MEGGGGVSAPRSARGLGAASGSGRAASGAAAATAAAICLSVRSGHDGAQLRAAARPLLRLLGPRGHRRPLVRAQGAEPRGDHHDACHHRCVLLPLLAHRHPGPGQPPVRAAAEERDHLVRALPLGVSSPRELAPEQRPPTKIVTVVGVPVVRRPEVDEDPGPAAPAVDDHPVIEGRVLGVGGCQLLHPRQTRMQSLRPEPAARYRNVLEALWRIARTEGLWRPMRGMNITATGAGPAHALYFACYEKLKKTLSDVIHAGGNSHVANGAAGCVATLLHDAAMNPAEVVKQRMQMYNSPYQRVTDCVRAVWRNEGAGAFYRSYTTQLTMNIPFQAIHFMTYEFLQEQLNPHRQYNPGSHVVSGACAGAVAAAATTPLDVCKTLLNTQESLALSSNISGHITGMANAFRTVYQVGGVTAYFRGVQARVIYQMPSTAIAWSVYEFFKYILTKRQEERRAGK